jgi:multiple antibiotic resistance protein
MPESMSFITITISIFLLLNSYAQIPVFLALLANFDAKRQKIIIFREMIIALIVLIIFIFFGMQVLKLIGIKAPVIGIGGGFLLIVIALNMIFPKETKTEGLPAHEPFIVPLAIPCIAGPATMTSVMLFAEQQGALLTTTALFVAWVPSLVVVLASSYIKNYLGDKGLKAVERLGGMLIFLVGIQMLASGTIDLIKISFNK